MRIPGRTRGYGWRRDKLDRRDQQFPTHLLTAAPEPTSFDLRDSGFLSPCYDQGRIGSCTANAIAAAVEYDRAKLGLAPPFRPSRLFIYFNERDVEGSIGSDSGAQIRDGIKTLRYIGVVPESQWAYDDTPADPITGNFPLTSMAVVRPNASLYGEALAFEALTYARVGQDAHSLRRVIASGYPVIFGFSVFPTFYDADGNPCVDIPIPDQDEVPEGGHAVLAVGYDAERGLLVRNSWGVDVQAEGHFWLPWAYAANPGLASDFWVLQTMKD